MELLELERDSGRWASSEFTDERELASGVRLIPLDGGAVLVCSPRARALVAGRPAVPVALLDEAELCVAGRWFRVRHDSAFVVQRFEPGAAATTTACARCKTELQAGDEVVRCRCNVLMHEGARAGGGEPLCCRTYSSTCICGRPTAAGEEEAE